MSRFYGLLCTHVVLRCGLIIVIVIPKPLFMVLQS